MNNRVYLISGIPQNYLEQARYIDPLIIATMEGVNVTHITLPFSWRPTSIDDELTMILEYMYGI